MEDFNLGKLIYEFSNALIEETLTEKSEEVDYVTEDRSCLGVYNKDNLTRWDGFINGYRKCRPRYSIYSNIYSNIYYKRFQICRTKKLN